MKLLLKDFITRWRWVLPIAILLSVIFPRMEMNCFFVFVVGNIIINADLTCSAIRNYSTLPLSRNTIAFTIWLEGCVLFPLIFFLSNCLFFLVLHFIQPLEFFLNPYINPPSLVLCSIYTIAIIGWGGVALCLLVLKSNAGDELRRTCYNSGWTFFLVFIAFFLLHIGDSEGRLSDSDIYAIWILIILIASVLSLISLLLCVRLLNRHVKSDSSNYSNGNTPFVLEMSFSSRLRGFLEPCLANLSFSFISSIFFCAFYYFCSLFMGPESFLPLISFMMVCYLIGQTIDWLNSLRSLRALPIARRNLSMSFAGIFTACIVLALMPPLILMKSINATSEFGVSFTLLLMAITPILLPLILRLGSIKIFVGFFMLVYGLGATSLSLYNLAPSELIMQIAPNTTGTITLLLILTTSGSYWMYRMMNNCNTYKVKLKLRGQKS